MPEPTRDEWAVDCARVDRQCLHLFNADEQEARLVAAEHGNTLLRRTVTDWRPADTGTTEAAPDAS